MADDNMIIIQIKAHKKTPFAESKTGAKSRGMTVVGESVDEAFHRIQILYEKLNEGETNIKYVKNYE